jgi:hypothetical protein
VLRDGLRLLRGRIQLHELDAHQRRRLRGHVGLRTCPRRRCRRHAVREMAGQTAWDEAAMRRSTGEEKGGQALAARRNGTHTRGGRANRCLQIGAARVALRQQPQRLSLGTDAVAREVLHAQERRQPKTERCCIETAAGHTQASCAAYAASSEQCAQHCGRCGGLAIEALDRGKHALCTLNNYERCKWPLWVRTAMGAPR